jgi:hypothetical protein
MRFADKVLGRIFRPEEALVMKRLMVYMGSLGVAGCVAVPLMAGGAEAAALIQTNTVVLAQAADSASVPDSKRLLALGMIETGGNDRQIGGDGEVSRYQLSRAVWKSYRRSDDYSDPEVSMQVAWQHWTYLANYFKQKAGREPDDFDMYVLWNTRYGYYSRKGFSQQGISPVVRDRAERFVNLVNRKV